MVYAEDLDVATNSFCHDVFLFSEHFYFHAFYIKLDTAALPLRVERRSCVISVNIRVDVDLYGEVCWRWTAEFFGWESEASDVLLPEDSDRNICLCVRSILTKFCSQVFGRRIPVEFVNAQKAKSLYNFQNGSHKEHHVFKIIFGIQFHQTKARKNKQLLNYQFLYT